MTIKDLFESAAHVAEVMIALIAVSPFIQRAIFLIRTAPEYEADQVLEDLKLRRRMGLVQGAWTDFLHWARRERQERLTWREIGYRTLWCPLGGHHGKIWRRESPTGTGFGARCADCRDYWDGDSENAARSWLERGKETWEARPLRRRIGSDAVVIGEFASKLADAINGVSRPR